MNDYVVTITETRKRPFVVTASSEEEAKETAKEEWLLASLSLEQDDVKELQLDVIDKEKYERQLSPDNIEWHKFSEQLPESETRIRFHIGAELYYGIYYADGDGDSCISYWPAYKDDSIECFMQTDTLKNMKLTGWARY